jgi:UDP-glucose 4-epimerase
MAKVLVTGGAGFIGSHIVDALLADGHHVEVIDDLSSGNRANLPATVTLHVADIATDAAREVVRTFAPEVLVHAAAQISVRESMDDPTKDSRINVTGFVSLLSELRTIPGVRCIFLSTGGAIYGEQSSFPATEDHPVRPESVYGLSKWVGEHYLEFWSRVWGVKRCVLRLANVYGPRQNPHGEAGVVAIFCRGLLSHQPLVINGEGHQTRDFVYVGDVARAVAICARQRHEGTFNIGTGVETSVNTLVAALREAAGTEGNISHGPAKGGEQLRSCIDPSRAEKIFGWKPEVSLPTGVASTMKWFTNHLASAPGKGVV